MAGSPNLKLYNPMGEYVACFKHAEDAAALAAIYGHGAEIRDGHNRRNIVWSEGHEEFPASASYDAVAQLVYERINHRWAKAKSHQS